MNYNQINNLESDFDELQFLKFNYDSIVYRNCQSLIFLQLYLLKKFLFMALHFQHFYPNQSPFEDQITGLTWSQASKCYFFSKKLLFLSFGSKVSLLKILPEVVICLLHKLYLNSKNVS